MRRLGLNTKEKKDLWWPYGSGESLRLIIRRLGRGEQTVGSQRICDGQRGDGPCIG